MFWWDLFFHDRLSLDLIKEKLKSFNPVFVSVWTDWLPTEVGINGTVCFITLFVTMFTSFILLTATALFKGTKETQSKQFSYGEK